MSVAKNIDVAERPSPVFVKKLPFILGRLRMDKK